jgi:pimeloyl-ACP methyl ester carboxylesterase
MTPTPTLALHELHDGGGMPLVLLPAYPLDSRVWRSMAKVLPWGVRAIGVDLPGQGHSDIGGLAPSLELAADAVFRTLREHGIGNAIVCGLSMGGYAALALAERHPSFVAGLGLVDTNANADDEAMQARRIKIARDVEMSQTLDPAMSMPGILLGQTSLSDRRQLLATIEGWVRGQAPNGIAWAQRAMARRPNRMDTLRDFDGPVAVLVGSEDRLTTVEDATAMKEAAIDGTLTVIPNCGHLAPVEDPRLVAKALAALHARVVPHRR